MIRRPPRSTLFPTRRSSDLLADQPQRRFSRQPGVGIQRDDIAHVGRNGRRPPPWMQEGRVGRAAQQLVRSEEHTSELQSPCNLVCRLLLEKKNRLLAGTRHG